MKPVFLDFEQPIAELTNKIEELRYVQGESAVDITEEINRLQKKSNDLTKSIYAKLTPAQVSQVSRHPQRPYTLDYVKALFTDFTLSKVNNKRKPFLVSFSFILHTVPLRWANCTTFIKRLLW